MIALQDDMDSVYDKELGHELLYKHEEYQLTRAAQSGDANALERLLLLNMRLVRYVALKYEKPELGVCADDLMADGILGLHHAISKFDFSFGARLSTYAILWIHQRIARSSLLHSSVRLPVGVQHEIRAINKVKMELRLEGLPVTVQSISERMDIPIERVEELCSVDVRQDVVEVCSLEDEIDIGDGLVPLQDMIADESAEVAYEQVDLEITLEYFLSKLSEQDRFIVERHYGIPIKMTYPEIGKVIGCSHEWARVRMKSSMAAMQRLARALRGSVDEIKAALENPYVVMKYKSKRGQSMQGQSKTSQLKTIQLFAVSADQIDLEAGAEAACED